MGNIVKVTRRGQVTIPIKIRGYVESKKETGCPLNSLKGESFSSLYRSFWIWQDSTLGTH